MGLLAVLKGEEPNFFLKLLHHKDAGQYGEYLLRFALQEKNLKGHSVCLSNLYLPYKDCTTEVDLILLHEKGIFVFESKNYRGKIEGTESDIYWTQILGNCKRIAFYNPILQNRTHIKAVAQTLHIKQSDCTSCIVFSHRSTLKQVPESDESCLVLRRKQLLKKLRKILRRRSIIYSPQQLDKMAKTLKKASCNNYHQRKAHAEHVQSLRCPTVCPLCGGKLEKRTGRYGMFLGCENFPDCRYTHPLA